MRVFAGEEARDRNRTSPRLLQQDGLLNKLHPQILSPPISPSPLWDAAVVTGSSEPRDFGGEIRVVFYPDLLFFTFFLFSSNYLARNFPMVGLPIVSPPCVAGWRVCLGS